MTTPTLRGAIPAMPLALDVDGGIDWRAQRAVTRYHLAAGVDGLAVGVHTTQFELHHDTGALREVWQLVRDEARACGRPVTLVAGVVGDADHAAREASVAAELGYDAALMCGYGMAEKTPAAFLTRADAVGEVLPTIGFYMQETVGGVRLPLEFWLALLERPSVVGVKAAPFDRYRTRDVALAVLMSDRWREIALLTGNDDAIVADLVTPQRLTVAGERREVRFCGGLLGQYTVGTRAAVELTHRCLDVADAVPGDLLALGADLTEVNAAVFDVAHAFAGCVPGVNEVLRQQGLVASALSLNPAEVLSPGQADLIAGVRQRHPELCDEDFVAAHRDEWLRD